MAYNLSSNLYKFCSLTTGFDLSTLEYAIDNSYILSPPYSPRN
jgi:hypothetical protein